MKLKVPIVIATTLITVFTAVGVSAIAERNTEKIEDDTTSTELSGFSGMTGSSSKQSAEKNTPHVKKSASNKKEPGNSKNTLSKPNVPQQAVSIPEASATNNPINQQLYVNPALRDANRPSQIASQPTGRWFGGWNNNIENDVKDYVTAAARAGKIPTLVAYNIPSRDCGSYSAGGSKSSSSYRSWINSFSSGIGKNKAIVILEPDALAGISCLSARDQNNRYNDISFAVSALAKTGSTTYIDAGNHSWQPFSVMSSRLSRANIAQARGFSINVSGFARTDNSIAYATNLNRALGGGKGYVIDTSRNGNGPAPANQWCNPSGRALGFAPTTQTGTKNLDAYLWIKVPGESDGTCNGGPSAGVWSNKLATELILNTK